MLLGSTGTWHQHLGAFQTARHFTTHGQPIGKTGRKNRERKATQGNGMIYLNKSIPVPHWSRYRIEDLVAKIPKDFRAGEVDWGKPVGKEAW